MLCDICGDSLGHVDTITVPPRKVVLATQRGFVPRRLPPSWKPQCELLGISIASHWRQVVDLNAAVDWGLCAYCSSEVERF